jgi:hypothetical protein
MLKLSLFVRLESKPGKEEQLSTFLMQALELANQEATTPLWFALRLGPSTLLAAPPVIEQIEVLGAKLP